MENAYGLALKIADELSKRRFLDSLSQNKKDNYQNLAWQDIEKLPTTVSEKLAVIKEGHKKIFDAAYFVLRNENTVVPHASTTINE